MKQIIVFVCLIALVVGNIEQILDLQKESHKICQEKNNVPIELIEKLENGAITEATKDLKCYIACMMEQVKTMKDGKFDLAAATEMIETKVPESHRENAKKVMAACTGKSYSVTDPCELAWEMSKCWKTEMEKGKKTA